MNSVARDVDIVQSTHEASVCGLPWAVCTRRALRGVDRQAVVLSLLRPADAVVLLRWCGASLAWQLGDRVVVAVVQCE